MNESGCTNLLNQVSQQKGAPSGQSRLAYPRGSPAPRVSCPCTASAAAASWTEQAPSWHPSVPHSVGGRGHPPKSSRFVSIHYIPGFHYTDPLPTSLSLWFGGWAAATCFASRASASLSFVLAGRGSGLGALANFFAADFRGGDGGAESLASGHLRR